MAQCPDLVILNLGHNSSTRLGTESPRLHILSTCFEAVDSRVGGSSLDFIIDIRVEQWAYCLSKEPQNLRGESGDVVVDSIHSSHLVTRVQNYGVRRQ
ncbi:hypothetical protein TNCV_2655001 [Trichonephila clavipes]|nr:hypothetical protein TNCV_2655001 [Trichonephila clavipes]